MTALTSFQYVVTAYHARGPHAGEAVSSTTTDLRSLADSIKDYYEGRGFTVKIQEFKATPMIALQN